MAWWIWIMAGLGLLGVEALTPGGFFILFFGTGALVVGILTAAGVAGPVWTQWLLFSVLSVGSLLLLRRPLLQWGKGREPSTVVDALEGETAIALEDLGPDAVGKAELRGASWTAQNAGAAALTKGQRCRVVRVEGLTLFIRAL